MITTIPPSCTIPVGLHRGSKGDGVRVLQEWLTLRGSPVIIDGLFGVATESALRTLTGSGSITDSDEADFLSWPMRHVVEARGSMLDIAEACRIAGAREVGGPNRGPWCRLFGKEGDPWCGHYQRWLALQAGHPLADLISPSCDRTVYNLHSRLTEHPSPGDLFLCYRPAPGGMLDYHHMGLVVSVSGSGSDVVITTNEGNSNDTGSREGVAVVSLHRSISQKAFIRMTA